MSNSVNLSLDVTKTGIQNPLIKVRQGDGGFETLHTTVTSNGEPMDLQGWTITFMGTTAGNHKIVDGNVKLVEAPNGIFDYTPSKAWGMDIGEFKIAYFKFVKGDGSASSANFRVSVIEAVDLTQEEAQNYISVVDTTIAEINQHLTDSLANVTQSIADANNNANTVSSNVTALGKRVDDYNNKLANIEVGGRNYMLNSLGLNASASKLPALKGVSPSAGQSLEYLDTGIKVNNTQGNAQWYYEIAKPWVLISNTELIAGETYTISLKVKGNVPQIAIRIGINNSTTNTSLNKFSYISGLNWTRVVYTFTIPSDAIYFYLRINGANNNQYDTGFTGNEFFIMKELKLEEGNIATDWTPAPEDAPSNDAQLVHKTGTETIAGDKTFTSPINGQLSGNAATATRWQTARTLALTGDVTGSVAMDGSGNVSMTTTGANLVHKSGSETIAGDKTFTGKIKGVTKIGNVAASGYRPAMNYAYNDFMVQVTLAGGNSAVPVATNFVLPTEIPAPAANLTLNLGSGILLNVQNDRNINVSGTTLPSNFYHTIYWVPAN